jgi:hypothetical protein
VHPSLYGFVANTNIDIGLRVEADSGLKITPERASDKQRLDEFLLRDGLGEPTVYVFPRDINPPAREMSRFMAKMALEAVALRFSLEPRLLDLLVDEPHYDRIREWARRGDNMNVWPIHQRRVFPEETLMAHPTNGAWVQAGFGYDLFLTKRRETYFAFCLYGYEFVINVGGPSIRGYQEWLTDHGQISPLIERVGSHLERSVENGKTGTYMVGQQSVIDGATFDRRQMGEVG